MAGAASPLDVIVVGAGLSGSLAALRLARDGHRVTVYEQRLDPRTVALESGRTINMGLSARGMAALREVGLLDAVLATTVPMRGRVVHRRDGSTSFHPYGTAGHQVLHSVLRDELVRILVAAADAHRDVRFVFGAKLTDLDVDAGCAWFADQRAGVRTSAKADLVIGADGVWSAVREHVLAGSRADFSREFMDWGYKELTIPSGPGGVARVRHEAFHLWPRRRGLILANPNADGSVNCTLFLPHTGDCSFESLRTPEAVRAFFDDEFPDTAALMPDVVHEFMTHPTGSLVAIRTSRWRHRDKVVLIGDACHAVWPFYAQGMNAALEDATVLAECLRATPGDRSAALAAYEARRRPHTDVLAELTRSNFVELSRGMRSPLGSARKRADQLLGRLLPGLWRPLYSMVAHTTMPYGDAVRRARRQSAALRVTAASVVAAAALAGVTAGTARARAARGGAP